MKKLLVTIFLISSLSLMAEEGPLVPQLYVSDNWEQGGIGQAFLYPSDNLGEVQATLTDEKGSIKVLTHGFPYQFAKKDGGYRLSALLMGLSARLPAGNYTLNVSFKGANGEGEYRRTVSVSKKDYKKATIKMGKQGTAIATGERTPERDDQARRFYAALVSFNEKALYDDKALQWPISRAKWRFSSVYGTLRTFLYSNGKKGFDFHNGQDLAGVPVGTPVEAALAGKVVLAENRIVTGNTVIIEHLPGVFTLYYHMSELKVKTGKKVKAGDMIGRLGATGFVTGPHLHFMVHVSGQDVDPAWVAENPLINRDFMLKAIKTYHDPVN